MCSVRGQGKDTAAGTPLRWFDPNQQEREKNDIQGVRWCEKKKKGVIKRQAGLRERSLSGSLLLACS